MSHELKQTAMRLKLAATIRRVSLIFMLTTLIDAVVNITLTLSSKMRITLSAQNPD